MIKLKRAVMVIGILILMAFPALADDSIQVYPPFTIPNQVVLDKMPQKVYVVVFGGTYTEGSNRVNPFTSTLAATATYRVLDPRGGVIASGQLTFNDSVDAFIAEVSPSLFREPGAYRIVATVSADVDGDGQQETSTAESMLKVIYSHGSFIRLSEDGINALSLTSGILAVKRVGASSVTFDLAGKEITLNPEQSIGISIAGVRAALIVDGIETVNGTRYASVTVTYPADLSFRDFIELPVNSTDFLTMSDFERMFKYEKYHPYVVLSNEGDVYKAKLSRDGSIEFSQLLYSGFFGLVRVFQDFRIEPPADNVQWFITMRAGISFSDWAAAGYPLSITEALDALLVWETEPHVQVNWKSEKWRQIAIFATKLAEKVEEFVDLITPDMIEPSWNNFRIPGGFWTRMFAEHYDEAVSAYVVAADWSIGDIDGIEFNWDEMWSALLNGEIIVSVDFIIEEVTLEFRI